MDDTGTCYSLIFLISSDDQCCQDPELWPSRISGTSNFSDKHFELLQQQMKALFVCRDGTASSAGSETAMKLTQAQSTINGALSSRVETSQETTSSSKGKRNENFLPPPDAPLIYLLNEQIGHRNTFSKVHWSHITEAEYGWGNIASWRLLVS